jgi:dTDP-4-dehydrorhamnose reductase
MAERRVLLLGKNGQVGRALQGVLDPARLVALGRSELDLADGAAIRHVLRQLEPSIIVNAAAYTAVDLAESEEAAARAVNATAPGILAEEASRLDALLVHYSTDYVFDGLQDRPYVEDDPPNPLNAYGRTKLAGEQAIQAVNGWHLILRSSWVYGPYGHNFLLTILRLARERSELRVVSDQVGAPTSVLAIARATAQLIERGPVEPGLYHLSAGGQTSWYDFARAALEEQPGKRAVRVVPISTEEYPTPARRPAYSVLSNKKLTRAFGLALPDWRTGLKEVLQAGEQRH